MRGMGELNLLGKLEHTGKIERFLLSHLLGKGYFSLVVWRTSSLVWERVVLSFVCR